MLFWPQIQIALVVFVVHVGLVENYDLPENCENGYDFVRLRCGDDEKQCDVFGNVVDANFTFDVTKRRTFKNIFVETKLNNGKKGKVTEQFYKEETIENSLLQGIVHDDDAHKAEFDDNLKILEYAAGMRVPTANDASFIGDIDSFRKEKRLNFSVTLDPKSNSRMNLLNIYMAKYHLNGTLLEFNFTGDELLLCSRKDADKRNYLTFGNNINLGCHIDLTQFLDFRKEMFFYKFYLFDTTGDNPEPVAYPIPILIENIQDPNNSTSKESKLKFENETKIRLNIKHLVSKMFLFDNLSGVDNMVFSSKDLRSKFKCITYAKKIKFEVNLTKNKKQIESPLIKVFYSTRMFDDIENFPNAYVEFVSEYKQDIQKFKDVSLGLLIAICIISVALVAYRMYVWTKLNPKELIQEHYALNFIGTMFFKLFKFFGLIMFFFLYILTLFLYIFYKWQYKLYMILPIDEKEYTSFYIVFGISCGTYVIFMCYRLYCQLSFDIFFIDWEPEKEIFINNLSVKEPNIIESRNKHYRGAWRLLHVANQFHALQCRRNISLYFGYCILLACLYFKDSWQKCELHVPLTNYVEYAEINVILRYFIATSIIGIVGASMFLFRFLVHCWLPYKETEFVDLCSVANISVFILNEKLHGFYIYGKSVNGKADLNLSQLYHNLDMEGQKVQVQRGVAGQDQKGQSDEQVFEMYISVQMREIYEGLFLIQNETLIGQNQKKDDKAINQRQLRQLHQHFESKGLSINVLRNYMNNQLKVHLENAKSSQNIAEQTCIQKVMDYPPNNIEVMQGDKKNDKQRILLLRGTSRNFDDVLFSGMEFEWFIMDLYLFQMWMIALENLEIAMLLTFVIDQILYLVRVFIGEKNLSKKAVIDNRFIS